MSAQVRPRSRFALPRLPVVGARLKSATTTITAIGVVGVAIILAAWINWQARLTADQILQSVEIRERSERFLGHVRDAETGQRGYLLTQNTAYLAPFIRGRSAALPELDALDQLIAKDSAQQERIDQARENIREKFEELDAVVALTREGRLAEALAKMRQGSGVTAMDAVRATVQQIQLAENIRLVGLNRSEDQRRLFASTGIIVALAGLAFAAWQQLRTRQRRSTLLASSNAELERMVSERTQELENERLRIEALLRDVNHRVGNNLAMVSALLNVQSRQTQEPAVRTALSQAQSRIQAIAAGQRRLRLDIETDEIDARPYMEDLLDEIGKAVDGRPIGIELDVQDIRLPGRDAVSFVVIVNELVTNAIKHAFPGNMDGQIRIRFEEGEIHEEGKIDDVQALVLTVTDDGVGLTAHNDAKGLGQTVIASLMRSMRAKMTMEPAQPGTDRPGCRITLTFPKRS